MLTGSTLLWPSMFPNHLRRLPISMAVFLFKLNCQWPGIANDCASSCATPNLLWRFVATRTTASAASRFPLTLACARPLSAICWQPTGPSCSPACALARTASCSTVCSWISQVKYDCWYSDTILFLSHTDSHCTHGAQHLSSASAVTRILRFNCAAARSHAQKVHRDCCIVLQFSTNAPP